MLSNHLPSLNYNAAVLCFNDVLFFITHGIGVQAYICLEKQWDLKAKVECVSGNNPCLRYFVKFLAAQGCDTAQQDERGKRLKGWDVSAIRSDNVWGEQQSRAAPAPLWPVAALLRLQDGCQFVPAPGALFVTVTRHFGPRLGPSEPPSIPSSALCPLRRVSLVPRLTLWCAGNQGSVFYNISRAVLSHFSARLISTHVSNSTRSRLELLIFFQIIFF